jgi:RHS repeat-associated protein
MVYVTEYTGTSYKWTRYATTVYGYDLQGNLVRVMDELDNLTEMSYDAFGRKTGMTDPDMGAWSYTYNAAGSLVSQKDARGNQLCFGYDKLDRLLNRTQDSTPADACPASPPTSGSNHLATYTYDPSNGKGQIGTVSWGPTPTQNKDTFTYDTLGRLTKQTRLIDNRSYAMETTSFDPLQRPLTIKYPTNEIVTLTYDHEGEQTLKAGADTLVGNVTYNGRGQLVLFDRGGSAPDSTFLYHPQNDAAGGGLGDSNFRLKTIQHGATGTGNAFPDFTYEYDKVSNISKLTTLSTAGTDTQTFTYDDLNRLLTAGATGGVANYSQTYAYSKIGNITSFAGNSYAYSGGKPHAVTHIGGVQKFWYDANGNMITRIEGTTTYSQVFDVENRLTSVTPSGGSATTFAYDASGIRTKTVQPGGITTYFPFPGYEETVNGANTIKRSTYSFAGQTVAMRVTGDPVSGNNGLFYVLSDHLGSTSILSNSSGGVVSGSTTRYLPFGGYRTTPSQTITDRDFTGQKENADYGLLFYNARFYIPYLNRFASADTVVSNPNNPQSFNRYSYVLGNPLRFTDPTGHVCYDSGTGAATPGDCNGGSSFVRPLIHFTADQGLQFTADEKHLLWKGLRPT